MPCMMWIPYFNPLLWTYSAGLEAFPFGSAWEAIEGWRKTPEFVQSVVGRVRNVAVGLSAWRVPFDVHDDVLPAVAGQIVGHVIGVGFHFFLADVVAVSLPTVPAHGRLAARCVGSGWFL